MRPSRLIVTLLIAGLPAAAWAGDAAIQNDTASQSVQGLQQRILADPETAKQVDALRDDPTMQDLLADPDIAAALARGDIAALLADPRIQRLADDPAIQGLSRQVGR